MTSRSLREQAVTNEINRGQALAEDSAKIGNRILTTLDGQQESQIASAENIETTEHALQKSLRIMRGMTWRGMFYNMVTSDPTPQSVSRINRPEGVPISEVSDTKLHYQNRSELLHGSTTNKSKDAELEQLSNTVSQLEGISLAINSSLKGQHDLAEGMTSKTEEVHTLALAAVLKSAQLTQRAKNSPEVEMGCFYFCLPSSGHYLSVDGSRLVLSPIFDRAAVFRVFAKESHLMAVQSCKTFKYIGVTMWGSVAVTSQYFGSYEEMFVDLDGFRNTPGMLMLISNWGGGGWLQAPVVDAEGKAVVSTVTKDISDSSNKLMLQSRAMSDSDYKRISATEK